MTVGRALNLTFGTLATMLPVLIIAAVIVLAIFFFGQRFRLFGDDITLAPTSLANVEPGEPRDVSLYVLLPKDGIRSIDDPEFVSVEAADDMADQEFVIGVEIDGDARAYPINVLSRHEIVNDIVGGRPVAVTYCPLCFTGIVYDRRVEGETLEFGVSGKLVMNDLVMYDRQTDSLWQQLLGEGITGHYKGALLTPVPATQTTWSQWSEAHPETLVLDKDGGYSGDSYAGYYAGGDQGVLGGFESDDRLPPKAFVLGIVAGDRPKAYPFVELERDPAVNDTLAGREVLVAFHAHSGTAVAFDRRADGRTLTFELEQGDTDGDVLLRDLETGSLWSGLSGAAIEGPLAGTELTQLPAFYSFWFAWSDFYVNTELFRAAAS